MERIECSLGVGKANPQDGAHSPLLLPFSAPACSSLGLAAAYPGWACPPLFLDLHGLLAVGPGFRERKFKVIVADAPFRAQRTRSQTTCGLCCCV